MNEAGHAIELLDAAAESDRVFLRGARGATLGEVAAGSHAVAGWLRQRGLVPGDRLLIAASNHTDAIIAALGAARGGFPFAFLHDSVRPFGFERIVRQLEPKCVVLDAATAALRPLVSGLPVLSSGATDLDGATPISALGSKVRIGAVRTDPLCLVYTSGSTGAPHGVMISHDNLRFTTAAIQQRLQYRPDDVIGLFLPLSFDYGLYQVFLALAARASLYVGALDHVALRLVGALEREDITVLPGVPTLCSTLVGMLARTPRPLPRLRAITNTGERLPGETLDAIRALLPQVDVFLMYGLTECKRVSILLPSELESHRGSVGRPLAGTAVEILDSEGRPAPAGVAGELAVRGPHVTMGYWRAPEATARRFGANAAGEWTLYTGDLCRRDREGFLYFEGRDDAQTKRQGFRISLLEIESAARGVSDVSDAAAVMRPPGRELHLFVTAAGPGLTSDAILRHLRDSLEPYKLPDRIHVLPLLPTTPHGKVDRQQLSALAVESAA